LSKKGGRKKKTHKNSIFSNFLKYFTLFLFPPQFFVLAAGFLPHPSFAFVIHWKKQNQRAEKVTIFTILEIIKF
jgi:hypothetical protein